MIVAFTGPESLSPTQKAFCRSRLRSLRRLSDGIDTWRSGGAFGLDTLVVEESGAHQDVELYVPVGCRWNVDLGEEYDFMKIVDVVGGYRRRNEALVAGADVLHAFPKRPTFYRSGTWMTINIARKAGVPVVMHVLPPA